jgi:putative ABC transport system permease protein
VSTLVDVGPALGIALVLLAVLAAVVSRYACLGHDRAVVVASLRAVGQLAAVSLVLAAVIESLPLTLLFVGAMYAVASLTAGRRLVRRRAAWWAALPVGMGAVPVVVALLLAQVVPAEGIAIVPVAGILIGGAMTVTALAGRRALDELQARRGEVEAGLALGLLPRDAALEVCRSAAGQALVPALDQTRTVGLVALPGAFVGTLLGGATPVEAGAVQVLILVALLAVQSVAIAATVELVARGTFADS